MITQVISVWSVLTFDQLENTLFFTQSVKWVKIVFFFAKDEHQYMIIS